MLGRATDVVSQVQTRIRVEKQISTGTRGKTTGSVTNVDVTTFKRSRYSADHVNSERLFLSLRRPVITFSLFGFYSCKYLGTIISLASEFHRGTRSASQVHTSLIEKAAVGPRRPRRLAASAVQRAQTSYENGLKKRKRKVRHVVCLLSYFTSSCTCRGTTSRWG